MDGIKEIKKEATKMLRLHRAIKKAEKRLSELKESYTKYQRDVLPAMLTDAGMQSLTFTNGDYIKISPWVSCKQKDGAGDWFMERGIDLGSRKVIVPEDAVSLLDKFSIPYDVEAKIHPKTLDAWAKEEISNGRTPPNTYFKVDMGVVAKVVEKE